MARRYVRDNRGRFASSGSGATARGGRLKTASGNKRQTQTMQAKGSRAGTIGKPKGLKPGALKPKPASSPASKPKFEKVAQGAGRQTAALPGGRRINIHNNDKAGFSAALIAKNGTPRMERGGFRNVTAAKAWAANPNARGPRLMGGALRTETTAKSTWTRTSRPKGTVAKPKGLKPGAIQARAAAKPAAKPAAATKSVTSKVDTSAAAIARRRSRAMAERTSVAGGQFNMKLNTRSQITRSAANEIYNRQRQIAKASGGRIDQSVARQAIGALPGLSGTKRQRAEQLREKARRRVVGGRRR